MLGSTSSLFYAFLQFRESSNRIIGAFLKTAKVNIKTSSVVFLKILAYQWKQSDFIGNWKIAICLKTRAHGRVIDKGNRKTCLTLLSLELLVCYVPVYWKKAKVQPVHRFQKKLPAAVTSMSILVTAFYGDWSAGIWTETTEVIG